MDSPTSCPVRPWWLAPATLKNARLFQSPHRRETTTPFGEPLPRGRRSAGWKTKTGERFQTVHLPILCFLGVAQRLLAGCYRFLQVLRLKPCPFCNSGEHSWAKFLVVMKSKDKVRPPLPGKRAVGACLTFNGPTHARKRRQDTSGTCAWPLTHAAAKETVTRSDPASPCSRRSATTRRARA